MAKKVKKKQREKMRRTKSSTSSSKNRERKEKGALFIPAGLFIGMGLGFWYNQLVVGLFLGLGVGFLLFAITQLFSKRK